MSHISESSDRSLKQQIYTLLNKNPLLTAKTLCAILRISYKQNHDYVAHVRSAWKYDPKNEHGLKCSIHAWRGYTEIPLTMKPDRAAAEMKGWRRTRARNRWLLFANSLGGCSGLKQTGLTFT